MAGVVGPPSAAPAAASGPAPGLAKPPLPHRPRGSRRSLKQRERESPDVDWDHSLQHFAAAVGEDLDELHARFLDEEEVSFAAWKRLWSDARMSAAFHVEFWESTPTNTHKAVLQVALDRLVGCIRQRDGEFECAEDVAVLIGRVFALYCAHAVQLGSPKHKIDVEPQAWTAMLTINCVLCGVGASLYPSAAREARAMMHRLAVKEKAFLRCLRGFGPNIRSEDQSVTSTSTEADTRQDLQPVTASATEEDAPVKQSKVEQLKALSDRYQELMSRTRSTGPSASASGARLGGRRGKPAVPTSLRSRPLSQGAGDEGQGLARALTSYVEYKANEEARKRDRAARAAAAREHESRTLLELEDVEADDSSNILDLSERGSVLSVPPSPAARSGASSRHSDGSEALLAELESELHADISTDQDQRATTANAASQRGQHHDQATASSEISEADSDALADLERELEESVNIMSLQTREEATPAKASPPARRKRSRNPAGIVARKAPQAWPRLAGASGVENSGAAAKRPRIESAASWATSSTAGSDGLADIQAELDAIPSLAEARAAGPDPSPRAASQQEQAPRAGGGIARAPTLDARPAVATPRAQQKAARRSTARANGRRDISAHPGNAERDTTEAKAPPSSLTPRAHRQAQAKPKRTALPISSRRSTRSSSVDDSDGLAELEAELGAEPAAEGKAPASTRKPRAARQTQPKKQRTAAPITPRRSTRSSSVALDDDSDGLAELEAELQAGPAEKAKAPAATRKPRAPRQAQAKSKRTAPLKATAKPPTRRAPAPLVSSRRSTRSSSVALDNDSDGLTELEAELQAGPASKGDAPAPTRKPRAPRKPQAQSKRTAPAPTSARRSTRSSSVAFDNDSDGLAELEAELQAGPASKVKTPAARRKPRAPRQTQAKPKRAAPSKAAAKRSMRQPPVTLPSSRRSTRSSATFASDSDGLAELEAELQAGHT